MKKILFAFSLCLAVGNSYSQSYWNGSTTSTTTLGKVGVGLDDPSAKVHVFTSNAGYADPFQLGIAIDNFGNRAGTIFRVTNQPFTIPASSPEEIFSVYTNKTYVANKLQIGKTYSTNPYADWKLSVDGGIIAKRLVIQVDHWADYVFDPEYKLRPLNELADFINTNKHLPEMPSQEQAINDGMDVSEMNVLLLKKVEELTLYLIDLKEENDKLAERIQKLEHQ